MAVSYVISVLQILLYIYIYIYMYVNIYIHSCERNVLGLDWTEDAVPVEKEEKKANPFPVIQYYTHPENVLLCWGFVLFGQPLRSNSTKTALPLCPIFTKRANIDECDFQHEKGRGRGGWRNLCVVKIWLEKEDKRKWGTPFTRRLCVHFK